MRRPVDPSTYAALVVNRGNATGGQTRVDPPRRALVRTATYGTGDVVLELDVIARARGLVCVRQERDGGEPWVAWIPADQATPL